jgi:hypothetical protein
MKRSFGVGFLLVLFAMSSYAAKNSQTVFLPGTVQLGSTQLPTGHYNVAWTGTGTDVEVTIASKGKQPATAKAQVVNEKHGQVGVITKRINGIEFLESILFPDVKLVIRDVPTAPGN